MTTVYATHSRYKEHDMLGYQHPEHSGRIESVWNVMREAKLLDRMNVIEPSPATDEMILRVHTRDHLHKLQWSASQNKLVMFDADTYALPTSAEIARLAAGGAISIVDAIATGQADNGLAAVRPPGHHATPNRAMGFCLLSNIAIAARHAQAAHNLEKILIVDFDVHHGNGTQDAFYDDPSVLFLSAHQAPFYPGTGKLHETGSGKGTGTTLNIPLSAGHGDANYRRIFQQIIWPAARRFQPDMILVSAGFDAHFVDPLAMMRLSLTGYTHLARELLHMADELCQGRIIFVMEGGYDLLAIGHGMRNIAHVLLREDEISDPYGLNEQREPDVSPLVDQILAVHKL